MKKKPMMDLSELMESGKPEEGKDEMAMEGEEESDMEPSEGSSDEESSESSELEAKELENVPDEALLAEIKKRGLMKQLDESSDSEV